MNIIRALPIVLLAAATNASAIDHNGASPATHMEIKDASQTIVCFAYDTDAATAPIASDCPEGTYTEQLFNDGWDQIGERSVVIGDSPPETALMPTRVERTCEWDEGDFRDAFSDADQGDNVYAFCTITCPEGVAIDGEARATIPGLSGGDDAILESVSFTEGTGTPSISIFVVSNIPLDVVFDRFSTSSSFDDEGFDDLTYVIEAAAVCL